MTSPLLLVVLLTASAPTSVVERAREAEERAFVAVHEERWCDAYAGFVTAHELVPRPALLLNAAEAARLAGDVTAARKLLDAAAAADDVEAVKEAREALDMLAKTPAGEACPVVDKEGAVEASPQPEPPAVAPEESPSPPVSAAVDDGPSAMKVALLTTGIGGVIVGGLTAIGAAAAFTWLELGVLRNPDASGEMRSFALGRGPVLVVATGVGAAILLSGGAALLALGMME